MQIMQSNANHDVKNEIIYNTEVLKCNLCDYNDLSNFWRSFEMPLTKCKVE